MLDSNIKLHNHDLFQTMDTGWAQVVGDERIPLQMAQDAVVPPNEDTIVIEKKLKTCCTDKVMTFYAIHQEVAAYVDDMCIYQLICPEKFDFFKSPGRTWVEIPLENDIAGKTMRIEFSSPFSLYRIVPESLYFVKQGDIQSIQIDFMWMRNAMALIILALAIISYVNASLWKNPKRRRYIFTLADVYLFTGLWLCSEMNILATWIGHATAAALLSMVFIRMIPVTFYHFLCATRGHATRPMRVMGFLAWSNLISALVLQFMFGISLVTTLPYNVAIFGVSSGIYLIEMIYQCWRQRRMHSQDKAYYATSVLLLAVLVEVYCYINNQSLGHFNGIFIALGCVIYSAVAHVLLVRTEAETDMVKRKLENRYHELEKKPLFQQINAHFLFNTLNTISAYCKEDPVKADRAVGMLAQYMRKYMNLVNCGDYVPFREEISLIQIYLDIQNLRFEENIRFKVDAQYDEFSVPPLTLQPLVENAVSHGIHNYVLDGEVCIKTRRFGDEIELIVSDNGQGFSCDGLSKTTGVGLKNLTRRITAMGGTLDVESTPGKGTDIILRIPLYPEMHQEGRGQHENHLCGR